MALISNQSIALITITLLASSTSFGQSIADIQADLLGMRLSDQQGRQEIRQIEEQYGYDSPEWRTAWDSQNLVDLANMESLEGIVDEIGWPKESVVGEDASMGAFLILQHADFDVQRRYLPIFKDAVDEGEADARSYALLYDRILMGEGEKQLFGTQLRRNEETGGYYLWPIANPEQVDLRRAELGILPLEEELAIYPFDIGMVPQEIEASFSE